MNSQEKAQIKEQLKEAKIQASQDSVKLVKLVNKIRAKKYADSEELQEVVTDAKNILGRIKFNRKDEEVLKEQLEGAK